MAIATAAAVVFATGLGSSDLAVAGIRAALGLHGVRQTIRHAKRDLRSPDPARLPPASLP